MGRRPAGRAGAVARGCRASLGPRSRADAGSPHLRRGRVVHARSRQRSGMAAAAARAVPRRLSRPPGEARRHSAPPCRPRHSPRGSRPRHGGPHRPLRGWARSATLLGRVRAAGCTHRARRHADGGALSPAGQDGRGRAHAAVVLRHRGGSLPAHNLPSRWPGLHRVDRRNGVEPANRPHGPVHPAIAVDGDPAVRRSWASRTSCRRASITSCSCSACSS